MSQARARAHANIALVKYWGKRDAAQNLPAAGSMSLTLDALTTETTVSFEHGAREMRLDGRPASAGELTRTAAWMAHVTARAEMVDSVNWMVDSVNHFPTASGLASSASGYAALALAATAASGRTASTRELTELARLGSGSAARSIFGGLVRMHAAGWAEPIADPHGLTARMRMVIAIVGGGVAKTHGSRDAMEHCAETSPYYRAWIDTVERDLVTAEDAIARGDLEALGTVAEANALAMHASAIAARPAIIYWQPPTLAALATVRALRDRGRAAWATMDAGPHVKVLTHEGDAEEVAAAMRATPGVDRAIVSAAGGPAVLL
jgi:diphosphomevalonate decarboxylase